jgi:hypothetical protein
MEWPSRGRRQGAQPGARVPTQPGAQVSAQLARRGHRPARGEADQLDKENDPGPAGVLLRCAGPGGHMPAWGLLYRPGKSLIRPGLPYAGLGFRIPAQLLYSGLA